ncbi:hypothetical protein [Spirulina subsalsa]|nr:hypothetical protein [Spirulina subsalsa]
MKAAPIHHTVWVDRLGRGTRSPSAIATMTRWRCDRVSTDREKATL